MKNNTVTIFFMKILITIVLTLVILILIKASDSFKKNFYKQVYDSHFSFGYLNNLYDKYISNSTILKGISGIEPVFEEKLTYNSTSKYLDGVSLEVDSSYLIPAEESGVIVFIGEKKGYNNTIIVQRIDGIDEWYGNVENTNVELYDYVKKGQLLGEAKDKLYLVYKQNGKFLNYEEYIK